MKKDTLFKQTEPPQSGSFVFDQRVVEVFDDMVGRSVPGYQTIQLLVADLAVSSVRDGVIYDLGCSTGATIKAIAKRADRRLSIVGIDNSKEMVERCRKDATSISNCEITVHEGDITSPDIFRWGTPNVVILNLTLQFVRPMHRKDLIANCFRALPPKSVLILVEKTVEADPKLNTLFIDYYHSFKRQMGYSEIEISTKREALENVLVPYRKEENISLLQDAGFQTVGTFFQWLNFSGFLAMKS